MQPYRCYFLDGADHVVKVASSECPDDASAMRWADDLCRHPDNDYRTEVWCRDRMIERRERMAVP